MVQDVSGGASFVLPEFESQFLHVGARKSILDSGESMWSRKDVSPEYFFVATLSLYKNVTDARLASCIAARNLAKHRRFYKGS